MVVKWLFLFAFLLFSCRHKSYTDGDILTVNDMKKVMWDIIQVDEFINLSIVKDSTKNVKQETLKLYSKVFSQHKISSEDFGASYNYYKTHPAMEKALLDSLQTYGSKMREKTYEKVRLTLPVSPVIVDDTIRKKN